MTRGRPKLPTPEVIDAQVNEEALQAGSTALDIVGAHERETATAEQQDIAAGVFDLGQSVGAALMANMLKNFSAAAEVRAFEEVNKSKSFSHLKIRMPDGVLRTAENIDEFCRAIFNRGYKAMNNQKVLLERLGEETYESANRLGLNRGQLRLLVSLPEEDRAIVEEAMRSDSKPDVLMAIETLASKLDESREALRKERDTRKAEKDKLDATHKADLQAKDRLMASVRERANKAEEKLAQLETHGVPADQRLADFSDDITKVGRKADDHLAEVANMVAVIEQYLTELFDPDSPQDFDRNNAILLAQRTRDQVWRLARNLGRAQSLIETSIYPLIEAEEMYLPYTAEDGRVLGDEVVG